MTVTILGIGDGIDDNNDGIFDDSDECSTKRGDTSGDSNRR